MIFVGGHSLGAARAYLYAFARAARGMPVGGIYPCGSPRPGNRVIGDTIAPTTRIRSLKNGPDGVTTVPWDIELLNEDYCDVAPFESIKEAPTPGDAWGPLAWHHIELYQAGASKLLPSNLPLELSPAVDAIARLYATADGWDWIDTTDGEYAAVITINGVKFLIFRGSKTGLDWINDFEAWQIEAFGAHVSAGFWQGVGPILEKLDAALAQ